MDGMPAGGGFAALFASPTLVWLLRSFLARPDTDFYQLELAGHGLRVLATVLAEAGPQLGREVNVTTYATDEFRAKVAAGRPFLTGVLDGAKIWLVGSDAELRAVLDGVEAASA